MKKVLGLVMMSMLIIFFSGCGGGSGATGSSSTGATGVGAKGPFVQGSAVTAYKLNTNGTRSTIDINATVTTDNLGNYDLGNIPWSGATEIVIAGNYFDENTGANSTTAVSLSAVVAIESGKTVTANVNIFTDLEARRVKYLMSQGYSFADAQTQARTDIIDLFDLNITADTGLQDLDLTDGSQHSQGNAELLRVSAAVAVDPSILDGLRHGIEDGNMTGDAEGKGAFVRLGNIVDDDVNMTAASGHLETDLNVTDAPDANDTDINATWVDRSLGHAPVLDPIADVNVTEDSGLFTVTFHATDADGDSLSYSATTDWSILGGQGSGISGATLSLVPQPNKNGVATVIASVDDGTGLVTTRTFTVTVNPVNDAPVANDDTAITNEDTNVTIDVLANDTDIDTGDTKSVKSVTQPAHGAVINGITNVVYTPNADFNGTDSFTYTMQDAGGLTSTATVTVSVTPVNDAPIAHDDNATLSEDSGSHVIDVLANDTDVDTGDTLTVWSVTQPTHGSVTIGNGSLNVNYTPSLNFNGTDTFTYEAKDSGGLMSTATVTLTVTPVNDAPVANPGIVNAIKNAQYSGTLSASDIDGDALTYSIVSQTDANGTVSITNANTGAFTYNPATDFIGDANFTFKVNDGTVDSNTATVTIHVVDRVINVTANDDSSTIDEDHNATINVLGNDVSTFADDNSTASGTIVSAVSTPSHGIVTINSDYSIKYVPNANYYGIDTFVYTAQSASGSEDNATVIVTINSVNDVPVISSISNISENEDSNDTNITLSATDADNNDTLTFNAVSSNTSIVTVSVSGTTLTVHPLPNANGNVDVNVSVDDGHGGIDSTLFTVTLNPVNDNPVATGPLYTTRSQDDPYSDTVRATDVDGDLNASGYALVDSNLSGGSLIFDANGSFTYNPNGVFDHLPLNVYGPDVSFRFTASDSHGGVSDPVTVSFRYVGLNDAPVVNEKLGDVTLFVGDVINNAINPNAFSDVDDNTTLTYTQTGLAGTGVSMSSDGNFIGIVTADPDTYSVTVTATDDHSASVSDTFVATVNYPAQASDVNNTAWVFSDGIKVVFYPTGQFVAVGVDGNKSFWDDGMWDINTTAHAVQLISSGGSVDFLYLPHTGPISGDIVTDRFMEPTSDDRFTLLINQVIDIQGAISDVNTTAITTDEVNSTAIRIVDGPTINLFADSTYLMIDNADQNISRTYKNGVWSVVGGALTLDNGDTNVTFAQSSIGEGTLGYHQESNGGGWLTVRQVVDINKTDPFASPYSVSASDINRTAMIFTDGNAMHFYEANATDGGNYWYKGRSADGVIKDKGTYQVETNGTITLTSDMSTGLTRYLTSMSFNSSPAKGTIVISHYTDGDMDGSVIRKIFGFGSPDYTTSLSPSMFQNKSIQLTNGNTYSFYPDGIFKMHGLSFDNQTYYNKQGTWDGSSSSYMLITYLDNSTDTFNFNESVIQTGTRAKWWSSSAAKYLHGVVKNVLDINASHAVDAYPEYEYEVSDVSNNAQIYALNGISYTVTAYSKDSIATFAGSKKSITISFYGSSAIFDIPTEYTSIVFKVYKDGEFVGNYGPFDPNSVSGGILGNHAFSE
ncbi:MAG: tandem-95 repeat protein [Sulfurospirillum sp.]